MSVRQRSAREAETEHRARIEEVIQRQAPQRRLDFEAARLSELQDITIQEVSALHLVRERRRNQGRRA